jgi:Flp pilus assembly protein TadD
MNYYSKIFLSLVGAAAIAACGGTPKKGTTYKGPVAGKVPEGGGKQAPERKVSADAVKDFEAAAAFHKDKTKDGWNSEVCNAVASRWQGVAGEHPKLVEARYNAGMAYHNCGMLGQAEGEYKRVLGIVQSHAPTISNIGEIRFAKGDVRGAKAQWELALKADTKLVAARNNLAWLLLDELRNTTDKSTWAKLEKEARDQLSSVLAVDQSNYKAYVLYGLVYLEGSERNKNRLDLAKLLLDEAAKHNEKYAPLMNARGLLAMRRNSVGSALDKFMQAVQLDPTFLEARLNVGNITLNFRKYDTAEEQFSYVIGKSPKNYGALIGLGIAQRGLGKIDDAEKNYLAAAKVDSKRGEAYYNLGVLYKDFRANKASDLKESAQMLEKGKRYFNDFLGKSGISAEDREEAKANIKDCDKTIKQIQDAIKAMAAAPASP